MDMFFLVLNKTTLKKSKRKQIVFQIWNLEHNIELGNK